MNVGLVIQNHRLQREMQEEKERKERDEVKSLRKKLDQAVKANPIPEFYVQPTSRVQSAEPSG
jgi:hypothetical protein